MSISYDCSYTMRRLHFKTNVGDYFLRENYYYFNNSTRRRSDNFFDLFLFPGLLSFTILFIKVLSIRL